MIKLAVPVIFKRTTLSFAVFICATCTADDKLDMSFIQGGGGADIWAMINNNYIPGKYLVSLSLNGKKTGKQILDVTPQDSKSLCMSEEWLTKSGIYISKDYFRDVYNATRQCYLLSEAPYVNVSFDLSTQSLEISIPQKALVNRTTNYEWDYGTSAFRVNYNVNANTGRNNSSAFGFADMKANLGNWVLDSSAAISGGDDYHSASINMFSASRAIQSLSADFTIGKTATGDSFLGSIGTYGVSLNRNNSMKPGNLGYTPVFSGVANGPSRVTLVQDGRLLHSEVVPTGPFSITDIPIYTGGDVTMTVTGEDGREVIQHFPLALIAGQLNPGQHEFSIGAGIPDDNSALNGGVLAASYGYGMGNLTMRIGGVFNQDWLGERFGGVLPLGYLGAVSIDGAHAVSKYHDRNRSGNKVQFSWSKQLSITNTGLQLSWSRQDVGYENISSFKPRTLWKQENYAHNIKDELNAGVYQSIDGINLSVSGWQRTYYNASTVSDYYNPNDKKDAGVTASLSTQVKNISLSLAGSGVRSSLGNNNWSISASVSIPFMLFERRYSSNTSVNTSQYGTGISTGISGSLNDRFSYSFSSGRDADSSVSSYINASYSGDVAYLNGALNNSQVGGTSASLSASGSVLAVPIAKDVIFSRTTGDTVAIVHVKDTPNVKVISDNGETDGKGNLVVPLNSYSRNIVTVDVGTLPRNTELTTTSIDVIPTDKSVIWLPFDAMKVKRYLLQVRSRTGEFISGGVWARDNKNTPLGFVANNGVLMINSVDALGDITLGECRISAAKIQDTDNLQEIMCE